MNSLSLLASLLLIFLLTNQVNSQTITCELFTITSLEPDTFDTENTLINIEMSGDFGAFANYPYIASVVDCVGDTIATGDMWFFGQIGGTTQGYPVTAIPDDVCLPITIEFVFGNDLFETDTCLLSYGVSGLNPYKKPDSGVQLFPNPANDIIQVAAQTDLTGKNYFIQNTTGKLVRAGRITTSNASLDVSQLPSGFYVLTIDGTSSRFMKH
jgi:hypothetical protein